VPPGNNFKDGAEDYEDYPYITFFFFIYFVIGYKNDLLPKN
jgi:hypothetical protein